MLSDIKPANIFFVNGVFAKIGDFSDLEKLISLTGSKSGIAGAFTIGFRAPEQVYSDMRRKTKEMGLEHMKDTMDWETLSIHSDW
ncbi:MAG: hypothetical protein J7L82_06215 [Staphylothermus sp.]|nr:hypothetical protein [Staphylothermus sp.]